MAEGDRTLSDDCWLTSDARDMASRAYIPKGSPINQLKPELNKPSRGV